MATVIECDGIRVEADSEREAMRELRKARRAARKREDERIGWREEARTNCRVNAWRLLDAFLGGWENRPHWDFAEADKPCGPVVSCRANDGEGVRVAWQSDNGDAAGVEFYDRLPVHGGIIDAGGWLMAIHVGDAWYAVGARMGESCIEKLPDAFSFPADKRD